VQLGGTGCEDLISLMLKLLTVHLTQITVVSTLTTATDYIVRHIVTMFLNDWISAVWCAGSAWKIIGPLLFKKTVNSFFCIVLILVPFLKKKYQKKEKNS